MYIFIQFVISLCEHYILFIFLFFDNIICASCSHAEKLKESVRKDETAKKMIWHAVMVGSTAKGLQAALPRE